MYQFPRKIQSKKVHAEDLSPNGILSAVRRRRAYISLDHKVSFQAQVNGKLFDIGQDVGQYIGRIKFTAIISEWPEKAYAQILRNGEVVAERTIGDDNATLLYCDDIAVSHSNWYRLDVYNSSGGLLSITNPIFVGRRKHPQNQTYGEMMKLAFQKSKP